jgi:hypothetical protein
VQKVGYMSVREVQHQNVDELIIPNLREGDELSRIQYLAHRREVVPSPQEVPRIVCDIEEINLMRAGV